MAPENIQTLTMEEFGISVGVGGGGSDAQEIREGRGLDNKNHFSKEIISNLVWKLLLTDLVDQFWRHKQV